MSESYLFVATMCIIPVASNTGEDIEVKLTAAVISVGNSTRNSAITSGPTAAPNAHTACAACTTGSLQR